MKNKKRIKRLEKQVEAMGKNVLNLVVDSLIEKETLKFIRTAKTIEELDKKIKEGVQDCQVNDEECVKELRKGYEDVELKYKVGTLVYKVNVHRGEIANFWVRERKLEFTNIGSFSMYKLQGEVYTLWIEEDDLFKDEQEAKNYLIDFYKGLCTTNINSIKIVG